jgi:hypothetical protein
MHRGDLMPPEELLTKKIGEEFTCVGEWWIPDKKEQNPQRKYSGTLAFTPGEGIVLRIMGQFESEKPSGPLDFSHFKMICGRSTEDELISLYECESAGSSIGKFSAESYSIRAVFVSKDAWLTPDEEIVFKSLRLEYSHLGEWVGVSTIRPKFDQSDETMNVGVSYEPSKTFPPIRVGDYDISLNLGYLFQVRGTPIQRAVLEQATSFTIKRQASKEISLDEVHNLVRGLQDFLSLAMYDEPIYPLVIEGAVEIERGTRPDVTMRLLYQRLGTRKPSDKILTHDTPFSYKDVADVWQGALGEMIFARDEELKPVLNEFFAEHYSPSAFVEDRFMAIIRAIEAFHRRTCETDSYVEKKVWKKDYCPALYKQVEHAVKEVPLSGSLRESFLASLKSRVEYAYQYSLRKRLDNLFDSEYGEDFLTLFAGKRGKERLKNAMEEAETAEEQETKRKQWIKEQRGDFVYATVKARNWFTHFDEDDKPEALIGGPGLEWLNRKLRLFMAALLLDRINVPSEQVKNIFRHHKFSYLQKTDEIESLR